MTQANAISPKTGIQSNTHEIFLVSFDEMQMAIDSLPPSKRSKAQAIWETIKTPAAYGASYYSSTTDAAKLSRLIREMGGFTTQAYVKMYGGKPHIILKGNPSLRKVLTGTKYGIKNPKIIRMGIGREAALGAARSGGVISIFLVTTYRVIDYFLTDEQTLFQFVGALAVDIVKVGIMVGASVYLLGLAFVSTLAIGGLVVVLLVGFAVGYLLNVIDDELQITQRVIAALEEIAERTPSLEEIKDNASNAVKNMKEARKNYINDRKSDFYHAAGKAAAPIVDIVIDATKHTMINLARNIARRTLNTHPRTR